MSTDFQFPQDQIDAAVDQISTFVLLEGANLVEARKKAVAAFAPFLGREKAEALAEQGAKGFQGKTYHLPWPDFHPLREEGLWYTGPSTDPKHARFWRGLKPSIHPAALAETDDSSTDIVSRLANPAGDKPIGTRGLVLGNVQSGKTMNYMSVVAKAADAGYRMFIILTGMTNSLRSQTQVRLENQLIAPTKASWFKLTSRDQDFISNENGTALITQALHSHNSQQPMRLIAVVKKNATVLKRLNKWLDNMDKQVLDHAPILIIDDEADQASINTSDTEVSGINQQLRKLVGRRRAAYVAYTATPFANLLIDTTEEDDLYPRSFVRTLPISDEYFGAERLFGRAESGDFGGNSEEAGDIVAGVDSPEQVAILDRLVEKGLLAQEQADRIKAGEARAHELVHRSGEEVKPVIDAIRTIAVEEADAVRPSGGAGLEDWEPTAGPALVEAIQWFILGTAARRLREGKAKHSTMLVHTAMFYLAHVGIRDVVRSVVDSMRKRYEESDPELLRSLRSQWEEESRRVPAGTFGAEDIHFDDLRDAIGAVLSATRVIMDNYTSKDRLDYEGGPQTVIVVGGNTLSRGLTLEGLMSSYFVRNASAYDTLLQMGRWFGYRIGWEDLPRIWMTDELRGWFRDMALVEYEVREDIDRYISEGTSPEEIGVLMRVHPAMKITSAAKMRKSKQVDFDFGGKRPQTTWFDLTDPTALESNLDLAKSLAADLAKLGAEKMTSFAGTTFLNVDWAEIEKTLRAYRHPSGKEDFNAQALRGYVHMHSGGELQHWNVVFVSSSEKDAQTVDLGSDLVVAAVNRSKFSFSASRHPGEPQEGGSWTADEPEGVAATIRALMGPNDMVADTPVSLAATYSTFRKMPALKSLVTSLRADAVSRSLLWRSAYLDDRPVLLVYIVDKDSVPKGTAQKNDLRVPLNAPVHVVGLAAVLPDSPKSTVFTTANVDELAARKADFSDAIAADAWQAERADIVQAEEASELEAVEASK